MRDSPSDACSILTHAAVEVRLSEIARLRDTPGSPTSPQLPRRFLRYCDEQTVVGMAAVLRAIDRIPEPRPSFDEWSVLAASCQAGRMMGAAVLIATRTTGASGVSPHVVPQCSLHSAASAVSVALSMHGPHFGIGGGPESFDEAMLSACAMLATADHAASADPPAGAWLILTAWDPEPSLDATGAPTTDPTCFGLAIAVVPGDADGRAVTLAVMPNVAAPDAKSMPSGRSAESPASRIRALAAAVSGDGGIDHSILRLRPGFELHVHRHLPTGTAGLEAA